MHMKTKWEIEAILDYLDRCREMGASLNSSGLLEIPVRDHLHKLIKAGYNFGKISLKGLVVSGTDFSEAKGLTIENWLSAKEANFTKLPSYFDFTRYDNLERVGQAGRGKTNNIYETDFSLVAGLNPDKPTAWDANQGMPKSLNFPKDWFRGKKLFSWNMQNTEDVTANELFRAKGMVMIKLPRGLDIAEAANCGVKMTACTLLDPHPIEDKKALNKWVFDKQNTVDFSSFENFLNAGSLDTLEILKGAQTAVKVDNDWVLVGAYIRKFLPRDLAERRYTGETETKAKALALGTI